MLATTVRRALIKIVTRESVERYLEGLTEEIASGEWVNVPHIGRVQVVREEGQGYVTSFTPMGKCIRRLVKLYLRAKVRPHEKYKLRCRDMTQR